MTVFDNVAYCPLMALRNTECLIKSPLARCSAGVYWGRRDNPSVVSVRLFMRPVTTAHKIILTKPWDCERLLDAEKVAYTFDV